MTRPTCIGFGPHEGKCDNHAGTRWSDYWCERCDRLRLEHIDKRMNALAAWKRGPGGERES